jgi:hypothetical protein
MDPKGQDVAKVLQQSKGGHSISRQGAKLYSIVATWATLHVFLINQRTKIENIQKCK